MKGKFINKQLGNVSAKVSAFVIIVVFIVSSVTTLIVTSQTYDKALHITHAKANESMKYVAMILDAKLNLVEMTTDAITKYRFDRNKSKANDFMKEVLEACPEIDRVSIMFNENYFPGKGKEYAPTMLRSDTGYVTLNAIDYGFTYLGTDASWLHSSKGERYWCDFYLSSSNKTPMVAFSAPIYDNDDQIIGVLVSGVNLLWLRDFLDSNKPAPDCRITAITEQGHYIYPPDSVMLDIVKHMADHLKTHMQSDDVPEQIDNMFVHHILIDKTKWKLLIAYPYESVIAKPKQMATRFFVINIIALALLFVLLVVGIYLIIRPFTNKIRTVTERNTAIEKDLTLASALQSNMLPKKVNSTTAVNEIEVNAVLQPAKIVGGDLYDYFMVNDSLFMCIGDVSGKGVPASLFMMIVHTMFRDIAQYQDNPAAIVQHMNDLLAPKNKDNMFCTLFVAVLDVVTGKFRYCNAGHNPPILIHKDGHTEYMEAGENAAIGIFDDETYEQKELQFHTGDTIYLYTDGVTEAENNSHELYGEKQLLATLRANSGNGLAECINAVKNQVSAFVHGAEQSDDITMLMVKYLQIPDVLRLTNDVAEVPRMNLWIEAVLRENDISPDKLFNVQLAVEEAVANVMNYAYPEQTGMPITITASQCDGSLSFVIEDNGVEFDPTKQNNPDLETDPMETDLGGMGIYLIKQLMGEVTYQRIDDKNILTLTLKK